MNEEIPKLYETEKVSLDKKIIYQRYQLKSHSAYYPQLY